MTATTPGSRATFTRMDQSTKQDWDIISAQLPQLVEVLPDRILAQLGLLADDHGGFIVDRLTHSLQTAARAERAGRSDEYVVCALLHDIGDTLAPMHHPDMAAAMLRGWVSPAHHWMVQQHGIFQGYYFWHHIGMDREARERFRDHEWFDLTAEFCAEFDMPAFDPAYPTPPLEHYEPLVRSFFSQASTSAQE